MISANELVFYSELISIVHIFSLRVKSKRTSWRALVNAIDQSFIPLIGNFFPTNLIPESLMIDIINSKKHQPKIYIDSSIFT